VWRAIDGCSARRTAASTRGPDAGTGALPDAAGGTSPSWRANASACTVCGPESAEAGANSVAPRRNTRRTSAGAAASVVALRRNTVWARDAMGPVEAREAPDGPRSSADGAAARAVGRSDIASRPTRSVAGAARRSLNRGVSTGNSLNRDGSPGRGGATGSIRSAREIDGRGTAGAGVTAGPDSRRSVSGSGAGPSSRSASACVPDSAGGMAAERWTIGDSDSSTGCPCHSTRRGGSEAASGLGSTPCCLCGAGAGATAASGAGSLEPGAANVLWRGTTGAGAASGSGRRAICRRTRRTREGPAVDSGDSAAGSGGVPSRTGVGPASAGSGGASVRARDCAGTGVGAGTPPPVASASVASSG